VKTSLTLRNSKDAAMVPMDLTAPAGELPRAVGDCTLPVDTGRAACAAQQERDRVAGSGTCRLIPRRRRARWRMPA
jgi:hypothetical protein